MPVMDGVEATHEILNYENEERIKHTPIVALTANALKGDKERFIEEGLDDYIAKPIENNELLFVLKKFLELSEKKNNLEAENSYIKEEKIKERKISIIEDDSTEETIKNVPKEPIQKKHLKTKNKVIEVLLDDEEPVILIAKKNPLEAQILSKVLANLGYSIDIMKDINMLRVMITDKNYDLLFIDRELEEPNRDILKMRHDDMNIIRLSLTKSTDGYYNSDIKDELIGIMKRDKLQDMVNKYRGL
jgi:CheY-like chemotaxis protein